MLRTSGSAVQYRRVLVRNVSKNPVRNIKATHWPQLVHGRVSWATISRFVPPWKTIASVAEPFLRRFLPSCQVWYGALRPVPATSTHTQPWHPVQILFHLVQIPFHSVQIPFHSVQWKYFSIFLISILHSEIDAVNGLVISRTTLLPGKSFTIHFKLNIVKPNIKYMAQGCQGSNWKKILAELCRHFVCHLCNFFAFAFAHSRTHIFNVLHVETVHQPY